MNYAKTLPVTGGGMGIGFGLTAGESLAVIIGIGMIVAVIASVIHYKFRQNKTIGE